MTELTVVGGDSPKKEERDSRKAFEEIGKEVEKEDELLVLRVGEDGEVSLYATMPVPETNMLLDTAKLNLLET